MPADPRTMNRVADQMANGCPSLVDAAYRLRMPLAKVEAAWKAVCRGLGAQAA